MVGPKTNWEKPILAMHGPGVDPQPLGSKFENFRVFGLLTLTRPELRFQCYMRQYATGYFNSICISVYIHVTTQGQLQVG